MSLIYRKKQSPFWFIQFIDAEGTRRNKSTGLRADDAGKTVKARALRAQLEAKELNRTGGEMSGTLVITKKDGTSVSYSVKATKNTCRSASE